MAWIETVTGDANLDRVDLLRVSNERNGFVTLDAYFNDGRVEVFVAPAEYRDDLIRATHRIAQVARGNAYISQANLMEWVRNDS